MPARFTSLTAGRCEDLLRLCARALPLDPFSVELLHRRVFDDPRFESELSLGIEEKGRLIGAAVAAVRTLPEGQRHGWIKLLAVDPVFRGQGHGRELLTRIEHLLRQRRLPQIDTAGYPCYFWPGVDVRYTAGCCLLESAGFREYRYLVNMAVNLDQSFDTVDEEQRLAAEGFTFHRADASDATQIVEFISREWPPWRDEVPMALANEPVSMFYCRHQERIVAYAAYDVAMFRGTFGSMGTDSQYRGRGLGAILLRCCLADMKKKNYPRCEIAWVGPVGFYARQVGAHINRVFRDYRKTLGE